MGNGSRAPAEVRTLIVWLAMFCAALLGCADSEEPRARRCERFREHLIELRMEGLPEADRKAHRAALHQALGERFTDECKELTSRQLSCGLAAKDISAAAACSGVATR